ncbi:MAG: hypothetical protein Alis3KO_38500 [Aliiglaciecola sp.]
MKIITKTAIAAVFLASSSTQAVEFGDYVLLSSFDFTASGGALPAWRDAFQVLGIEGGSFKNSYLCTDTTNRRVPGKVIDKKCWVEWNGNRYGNSTFYVLKNDDYQSGIYNWLPITNQNVSYVNSQVNTWGITNGGFDEGNYVFHCRVDVTKPGERFVVHGKYLPSRQGCYYEYNGAQFASMHQPNYGSSSTQVNLHVLTRPQYQNPTPPPGDGGGSGGGLEP